MFILERLRQHIDSVDAWTELATALQSDLEPDELQRTLTPHQIYDAFGLASVASEQLRAKLHAHPIPDWKSIGQYSDFSLLYHLQSGLTDASSIAATIATYAHPRQGRQAVLDFGAGLGRILRYLVQFVPEHNYHASEVNPLAVRWGQETYSSVNFMQTKTTPPLPLSDGSLDVAYAWSIFSHYGENIHWSWIQELGRVLRPGGILIVTVQGRTLLDRIAREEDVRLVMRLWDLGQWQTLSNSFDQAGYAFYESYRGDASAEILGIDPGTFGMAFVSPDYIRRRWTESFELLEYVPGKISQWQDYVVLRRR